MSFRRALYLALIPLALFPILILSIATVSVVTNDVNKMAEDSHQALARATGISLENYFQAQVREMQMQTKVKRIRDHIIADAQGSLTKEQRDLCREALAEWTQVDPDYEGVFLVNSDGIIINSYNGDKIGEDISDRPIFMQTMGTEDVVFSKVSDSLMNPRKNVIYISSKVVTDDYAGVLILETGLAFYNNLVDEIVIGETGAAFVTDENGFILCHSEPALGEVYISAPEIMNLVKEYKEGNVPQYGISRHEHGDSEYLVGYYVIPDTNWVFVGRQHYSEINYPIVFLLRFSFILSVGVLLITLLFCYLLIWAFSRPINNLRIAFAQAASKGQYVTCAVTGMNEFSELATGYNTMISRMVVKDKELRNNYDLLVREQQKSEYIALHDSITDIGNRNAFERKVNELLEKNAVGGILYLDLDGFKYVNDVFGHRVGDLCLVEIARKIDVLSGGHEVLARVGGDEFYIVKMSSEEQMVELANGIMEFFHHPVSIGELQINITASIGIACFPRDGDTIIDLMRNADVALYEAKSLGKDRYCVYSEKLSAKLTRQMDILEMLDTALSSNNVFVCYQPEVKASSGEVIGFETLVRMKCDKLGVVSPAEFIPLAESSGKIVAIGNWVMEHACSFTKQLLDQSIALQFVAVNVSTLQLEHADFVDSVLSILQRTKLPPSVLQIEITESVFMSPSREIFQKLHLLREQGVTIALDDFGTGYSSMQYLADLPLDVLKIDKYFIDEIANSNRKQGIVEALIQMAHLLGLKVVGEGVEQEIQKELLSELGCDTIQGYYYYQPMPEQLLLEKVFSR